MTANTLEFVYLFKGLTKRWTKKSKKIKRIGAKQFTWERLKIEGFYTIKYLFFSLPNVIFFIYNSTIVIFSKLIIHFEIYFKNYNSIIKENSGSCIPFLPSP